MYKIISKRKKDYIESGQTKNIQLAFVNKKDNELHMITYWMNCRDFFSDILIAEFYGITVKQYGMEYNPKKNAIDRDKIRILIKTNKEEDAKNIEENLYILNDIEEENKIEKTTLTKIKKNRYLYEGDSFWLSSVFSLNLFTYLIKCMGYAYNKDKKWYDHWLNGTEFSYLRIIKEKLVKLISGNIKEVLSLQNTVDGYYKVELDYSGINFLHNACGIVTLCKKEMYFKNRYFEKLGTL